MDGQWHSFSQLLRVILRSTKRLAVLVAGLAVTAAGVAMLVLPGPGFVVIIIGLAILATEFAWAEYLLDKAKEHAAKAADKAKTGIGRFWQRKRAEDAAAIAAIEAEGETDAGPKAEVEAEPEPADAVER